jgi:hypothetical protein
VLQLHLCFIYFFGGLAKCLGGGWWDGTNLWRALTRAPFSTISPETLVRFKYVVVVLGIAICVIELGYVVFIWIKKTRLFWLACILAMHVAIGLTMGLYLFALIMIVLNLAAFGVDRRVLIFWQDITCRDRRDPGKGRPQSTELESSQNFSAKCRKRQATRLCSSDNFVGA